MKNRTLFLLIIAIIAGILTVIMHPVSKNNNGYQSEYSSFQIPASLLNHPTAQTNKGETENRKIPLNVFNQERAGDANYVFSEDTTIPISSDLQAQINSLLSGNAGAMMPQLQGKQVDENIANNPSPTPIQYYDGGERVIGNVPYIQSHSLSDEFFYIEVKEELTPERAVYLEYDLYGVEDNTQVSRSINDQPAFGGYFVKQYKGWTKQREQLNPSLLHQGKNTIRFSVPDTAKYSYRIKDLRIIVDKSDTKLKDLGRSLIVNQPTTAYYYRRYGYVQGFVTGEGYEKAKIRIGGQGVRTYRGEFEGLAYRSDDKKPLEEAETDVLPSHAPWNTVVEAIYPDGEILSVEIRFEQPAQWDHLTGFNPDLHYTEQEVNREEDFVLKLGTALLEGKAGSVNGETNVSITALRTIDLPRLNPGMVNVTSGYAGYRFLPHGSQFEKALQVSIGYDSTKLPRGHYPQEIRTYYYDESRSHWVALPRDSVNKEDYLVCSRTTHFTDMINAIVKVPEMPETQEYTPTSLKELQAADPSSGIQLIQAPTA
ncbi:MAG: hypothetical protein LBG80_03870, partial [Bacteroidales bacterium]|nr:hypothetical protein [Bacteroidales bacterium]